MYFVFDRNRASDKCTGFCRTLPARFRCLAGETLVRFIRMRLERAQWLMRRAPASLSEIAIECGFGRSHFSRTFKKEYGVSPSRVRLDSFLQERKIGQAYPDGTIVGLSQPKKP